VKCPGRPGARQWHYDEVKQLKAHIKQFSIGKLCRSSLVSLID